MRYVLVAYDRLFQGETRNLGEYDTREDAERAEKNLLATYRNSEPLWDFGVEEVPLSDYDGAFEGELACGLNARDGTCSLAHTRYCHHRCEFGARVP